jgi:hypothetical protein
LLLYPKKLFARARTKSLRPWGDEDYDLDWLLERATDAALRDGIRVLVIDPWNELEHARRRDESSVKICLFMLRLV